MSAPQQTAEDEAIWGMVAEFATADALLEAAHAARAQGFQRIEAYAPFHVEGLAEAVGFARNRVAPITFAGGVIGGLGGYFMQWYSAVIDYPINVGGRPLHSWPMFIPVTFELIVLGAVLAAFLTVTVGNRLPSLYHPLFKAPDFDLAMRNRFFLCLRSDDPAFDKARSAALLDAFAPLKRSEVRP